MNPKRSPAQVLFAVAVLGLSIVGCSSMPPTHYYVLQAGETAGDSTQSGPWIGVRTFQVDPPYDDDRIVYRHGDSPEVNFYQYHRWAAPLARMLPTVVASSLQGIDGVGRIEPVVPNTAYGLFLHGRVTRVEEIDTPGSQNVVLHFDLRLTDRGGEELWSQVLMAQGSTQTEEVGDIVEAMSEALSRAIEPIRSELARFAVTP